MRHVLTLIAILIAPAGAQAAVTSDSGAPLPQLQAWADASFVPLPAGPIIVTRADCPSAEGTSCIFPGSPVIWLGDEGTATRAVFSHELGHRFDYVTMTMKARAAFKTLVHDYRPWRATGGDSPHEKFAEAYGLCFRKKTLRAKAELGFDYTATPALHRRVCSLIRATG